MSHAAIMALPNLARSKSNASKIDVLTSNLNINLLDFIETTSQSIMQGRSVLNRCSFVRAFAGDPANLGLLWSVGLRYKVRMASGN